MAASHFIPVILIVNRVPRVHVSTLADLFKSDFRQLPLSQRVYSSQIQSPQVYISNHFSFYRNGRVAVLHIL